MAQGGVRSPHRKTGSSARVNHETSHKSFILNDLRISIRRTPPPATVHRRHSDVTTTQKKEEGRKRTAKGVQLPDRAVCFPRRAVSVDPVLPFSSFILPPFILSLHPSYLFALRRRRGLSLASLVNELSPMRPLRRIRTPWLAVIVPMGISRPQESLARETPFVRRRSPASRARTGFVPLAVVGAADRRRFAVWLPLGRQRGSVPTCRCEPRRPPPPRPVAFASR